VHNAAMILTHAWRSWRNSKAVALLAAIALAAGIGSATAIYTVVNGVMLKPLPYRDGDRFVVLLGATLNDPEHYASVFSKDAEAYEQRTRVFDAFGWWRESGKNLTFAGEPHHVQGASVTTSLVGQLGVNPVLGQWFRDENGVVISNSLWRQLGSDTGIVGKDLTLDGRRYVVTGVMPESFRLPVAGIASTGIRTDIWMALDRRETAGAAYFAYARLKPGITFAAAEADVKRVAAEIAAEDPANHPAYTALLFPLRETVVKEIRPTLMVLFAGAGLLFLITCANASGLLLARSIDRARETAIRVALGAGRGQLAAHYFAEGLLISLAGAAGGVLLSITITPAIVSMAAEYIPRAEEITVDWTVLTFALSTAFIASALSSLAPLWQAARTAPADVLGEGVRASAGRRSRRLSQLLVVSEIALAFGLLAVSAVLIIHLRNLSRTSPGFDADHLLTFVLNVPGPIAEDPNKRIPLQRRFIEEIRSIPGVEDVALASQLPLKGCCMGTAIYPEVRAVDLNAPQRTGLTAVSPEYFRVMRVPLRSGRMLTDHDAADDLAFVVINQAASKHYWGDHDPVSAYGRVSRPDGDRFQVVGVVGDVKNDGLGNPTVPEVYILSSIFPVESLNVAVRSPRPAASLMPEIRRVVHNIDPEQPIDEIATMREIVRQTLTLERAASFMTAFFAGVGLLLAMLGVYSVVAYSVRQQTVEIGTRMALGATSQGVLSLVVSRGLKMAVYGMLAGGIAATAAAFYLGRLFKIEELGLAPFLYSTTTVAAVAFAASVVPAWRASMLSPIVAIRNESESMWRTAQRKIQTVMQEFSAAAEEPAVPVSTLIREFAEAIRQTASFPEAIESALTTLRERVGAQSIILLVKASAEEYRSANISIPARGMLLKRLAHFPHPLSLTRGQFDTWLGWAREFSPEHAGEIEALANTGARLAVPLRTKNEIVGVLLLGPPEGQESYRAAEKHVLSSSAEVFALMIENARLNERALDQEKLRRELELAAEVQRRLLPPEPPASKVATLAAFSLPARTVGGDYYDFVDLPGEQIGIAIADVSGKGIAAALLMSVVQASLRAIAVDSEVSLSRMAAKLNGFLYRSSGTNKYATFFYAQMDQHRRHLRYVNAGHNPPYLVRRTDAGVEITELRAGGTVLGLFPEVEYEEADMHLRPGDLLVAFTDGVTEALNLKGEEFGEQRLKDLLCLMAGAPAQDIASKLRDTMREWIGDAEQHDDLTFLAMAVK
jgi:putative ABC transport system permease protein